MHTAYSAGEMQCHVILLNSGQFATTVLNAKQHYNCSHIEFQNDDFNFIPTNMSIYIT